MFFHFDLDSSPSTSQGSSLISSLLNKHMLFFSVLLSQKIHIAGFKNPPGSEMKLFLKVQVSLSTTQKLLTNGNMMKGWKRKL